MGWVLLGRGFEEVGEGRWEGGLEGIVDRLWFC